MREDDEDRGLWHFANSGKGRFDLPPKRGTCYLASSAEIALRERLGKQGASGPVPASMLTDVEVSRVDISEGKPLADLCHEDAVLVEGMTREIHTTTDYATTQAWAEHFDVEGFGGIQYQPRHTLGREHTSFAVFGPKGAVTPNPTTILSALEVADEAGLQVDGPPRLSAVPIESPPDN